MKKEAERSRIKKRHSRKRKALGFLFLMAVLSAAAILCAAMFFQIQVISVSGTERYNEEEIIFFSGVELEQNLFAISGRKVSENLSSTFSYIEKAKIKRRLPNEIEIIVVEYHPELIAACEQGYLLLSEQGHVIDKSDGICLEDAIVLVGPDLWKYEVGTELSEMEPELMERITYILQAIRETGFGPVDYIDLSNEKSVSVLYDNRILIELGSEFKIAQKLTDGEKIISQQLDENTQGSLNLTVSGKGYFLKEEVLKKMHPVYQHGYFKYE